MSVTEFVIPFVPRWARAHAFGTRESVLPSRREEVVRAEVAGASTLSYKSTMLDAVIEIAREAGAIVNHHYAQAAASLEVITKEDGSPLTIADQEGNACIVERLAALAPDIPIITEETALPPYEVRKNWKRFWLVDPLDGTKEFIKRNGEFTVNIALIEDGEPVLGVVFAPAVPMLYAGRKGEGAWKIDEDGHPRADRVGLADRWQALARGHEPQSRFGRRRGSARRLDHRRRGPRRLEPEALLRGRGQGRRLPPQGPHDGVGCGRGRRRLPRARARRHPRPSPLQYNKPTLKNSSFVIGIDD